MIAPLASFGCAKVKVSKKPRAAILATGSEIVGIDEKPGRDQIRNSNSITLKVFTEKVCYLRFMPCPKTNLFGHGVLHSSKHSKNQC
jgi:molybdopterin biosynthesis enzyme